MSAPEHTQQTRVLYNADCPVCSFEIDHYRARTARDGLPLRFDDLNGPELATWGIDADQAARRLHVLHHGEVLSGMPAFRVLWDQMPHMRWAARVAAFPGLRQGLEWLYDRVGAPLLYRSHLRRVSRRKDG
ncbi:MAG: DUF393 domain-containing protein [Jannaschia sp.]